MTRGASDAMIRAQAAAWLARLRSDARTPADETGFRAWLREDVQHQQAFDLVNTAWEIAGGVSLDGVPATPVRRTVRRKLWAPAAVVTLAASLLVVGWIGQSALRPPAETFSTGVGEQRRVALSDGSTLMLDTSTQAVVSFSRRRRGVELVRGRAHFEVAKDETRPFVVDFGKRQVVAVGTAFDIVNEGELTSVLLTQGRVLLEEPGGRRIMSPGDRLAFRREKVVADKPDLEALTAWQSGRAVFENQSLKSAIAELNRYSRRPLVIADDEIGEMRISGSYKAGDAEAFAVSVSTLLPVTVEPRPDRVILLARKADPPPGAAP